MNEFLSYKMIQAVHVVPLYIKKNTIHRCFDVQICSKYKLYHRKFKDIKILTFSNM